MNFHSHNPAGQNCKQLFLEKRRVFVDRSAETDDTKTIEEKPKGVLDWARKKLQSIGILSKSPHDSSEEVTDAERIRSRVLEILGKTEQLEGNEMSFLRDELNRSESLFSRDIRLRVLRRFAEQRLQSDEKLTNDEFPILQSAAAEYYDLREQTYRYIFLDLRSEYYPRMYAQRPVTMVESHKQILAQAALFLPKTEADEIYTLLDRAVSEEGVSDLDAMLDLGFSIGNKKDKNEQDKIKSVEQHQMQRLLVLPLVRWIEILDSNKLLGFFVILANIPPQQSRLVQMRNAYLRRHLTRDNIHRLDSKIADKKVFAEIMGLTQTGIESDYTHLTKSFEKNLDEAQNFGDSLYNAWLLAKEQYYQSDPSIDRTKPLFNVFEADKKLEELEEIAKNISTTDDFFLMQQKRDELFAIIQGSDEVKKQNAIMVQLLRQVDAFLAGHIRHRTEELVRNQSEELSARFQQLLAVHGLSKEGLLSYAGDSSKNPDDASGLRALSYRIRYQDAALRIANGNHDDFHTLEELRKIEDKTVFVQYSDKEHKRIDTPKNEIEKEAIPPEVTQVISAILQHAQAAQKAALDNPLQQYLSYAEEWGYEIPGDGQRSPAAERVLAQPCTALAEGLQQGNSMRHNHFIREAIHRYTESKSIEQYAETVEDNDFFRDFVRLKSVKGAIVQSVAEQVKRTVTSSNANIGKIAEGETIEDKQLYERYEQLRREGLQLFEIEPDQIETIHDEMADMKTIFKPIYDMKTLAPPPDADESEKKQYLAEEQKARSINNYLSEALALMNLLEAAGNAAEDRSDIASRTRALETSIALTKKNFPDGLPSREQILKDTSALIDGYNLNNGTLSQARKQALTENGTVEVVEDDSITDESGFETSTDGKVRVKRSMWEQDALRLKESGAHDVINETIFQKNLAQKSDIERQEVTEHLSQLGEFAKWINGTDVPDKSFLQNLKGLDGKSIFDIVPDGEIKENAHFEVTDTGFKIRVKRSVWEGDSGFLAKVLRHEGLHAIDQASRYRPSEKLYDELKNNGQGFEDFYQKFLARYRKMNGNKSLSYKDRKKEFLAYVFSESLLDPKDSNEAAELAAFKSRNREILENFKNDTLAKASELFSQNSVRAGWWNAGERLSYKTVDEQAIEDIKFVAQTPDTFAFQYNQRRRRILKKLDTIQNFKAFDKKKRQAYTNVTHDILQHAEKQLEEIGKLTEAEREKVDVDQIFADLMSALKDHEKVLDAELAEIAYNYTEEVNPMKELWNNTTFLALGDFKTLFSTTKEFIERRHERNSKRRAGLAGKAIFEKLIPPLANEFDNVKEKSETDAVNAYKEQLSNKDSWQIMERVDSSSNTDELKACLYLLSERGAIDWNDRRIWRAFERYQDSIRFFPTDEDNPEFLRSKFQRACGILYDNDFFRDLDRKNASAFESTKQEYKEEANQNLDHMDAIVRQMIIDKRSGRKKVSPHRFEMYIDAAINFNKSTPIKVFWWILQGVNLGILNMERVLQFDSKYQNQYPMTNWFPSVKPTANQIRQIANLFAPKKDGDMPENFKDWFFTEVLGNKQVQERMRKSSSDKTLDHDWAMIAGSIGDAGTAQFLLATNAGASGRLPKTGIPNVIAGHLMRITTIAREEKSGHIQNKAFLKEQIAAHIEYVFHFNSIYSGRYNHKDYYGQSFVRDTYTGSDTEMRSEPREKSNYCSKKKTTLEFIKSNNNIIQQLDPNLFAIINKNGEKSVITPDIIKDVRNYLHSTYNMPEEMLPNSAPELGQKMSGIAHFIMDKKPEVFENILRTAVSEYERDHPGKTPQEYYNTYSYPSTEELSKPHPGYPEETHGIFG